MVFPLKGIMALEEGRELYIKFIFISVSNSLWYVDRYIKLTKNYTTMWESLL